MTPSEYKQAFYRFAEQVEGETGLPAKVLWAQSALETGWLDHMVCDDDTGEVSNNFFNVKALRDWSGPVVWHLTREEKPDGTEYFRKHPFRKYPSALDSFRDHARFITSSDIYRHAVAVRTDWRKYIQALKDAGYATDRKYVQKVTSIVEKYCP